MVFKITRKVPAQTTRQDPDWQKLYIMKGVIRQWILFMPEETADVLQFRVEYHGSPVLPSTSHQWMYGFFDATAIDDKLKIDDAPYVLDVYAFNEDDSYPHEYNLYVVVDPPKAMSPSEIDEETQALLEELMGGGE